MQYTALVVNDSNEVINADDARDALSRSTVDEALVDFNPGIDGPDLVARIRTAHPKMPITLVSADMQDEIIARTRELNAAFIAKPLTDEGFGCFPLGSRPPP